MARHSHWAQIKLKKGALDKKRGKIFARHAHLIEFAARGGSDPNMNASLRMAIENARADNLPRENIDRAIKKGTGELHSESHFEEISYEGYGPGGIAIIIDTLTDNKNRTSQSVRTILQKNGGTFAAAGATSFLFDTQGMITIKKKGADDEMEIIDAGAQDMEDMEGAYIVYTQPGSLARVRDELLKKGFAIKSAELTKLPKTPVEMTDKVTAEKLQKLLELLDEDDDVVNIYVNAVF